MKKALITGVTGQEGSYLAAQTHVTVSFEEPEYKANSDALGPLHVLEAIRILGFEKKMRSDQASASELYGLVQETPQARSWAWTSYHREKPIIQVDPRYFRPTEVETLLGDASKARGARLVVEDLLRGSHRGDGLRGPPVGGAR